MTGKLGRVPTEDENEQAKAVALQLVEVLREAPNVGIGISGIGHLVEQAFAHALKPEYLLQAFDEWAATIRIELEKVARHAHN